MLPFRALPISFQFIFVCCLSSLAITRANSTKRVTARNQEFDFIIIGGGTAGNVIANRLSENPDFQVLVIEAGPSQEGVLASQIPFLCTHLTPNTPYDWNYTTTSQAGLNGRAIPYPSGHILGGSSAVNFLIYTRGTEEDYDRYAQVSEDHGWSWKSLQPYFRRNEKFGPPADKHNITGQFNPSVHGFNGTNSVSLAGFPSSVDDRVMNTTQYLGGPFAFNLDQNSGNSLGLGWIQTTTKGPSRSSSATSYLAPEFLKRPNLHVLLNTQVSRLLQTGVEAGAPAFRGVEFRLSPEGDLRRLTARKEIILSAGSIGSPHILMNSGIGNATALNNLGVKAIVDLPDVGQNLSDHPLGGGIFSVTGNGSYDRFNQDPSVHTQELKEWKENGTGPLVNTIGDHVVFMRLPQNDSIFKTVQDPAAGPNSPHFELVVANGVPFGTLPPSGNFIAMANVVVQPTSRGSVNLRSSDPFDAPIVDPALLNSDFDKVAMREALKRTLQFFAAPAWSDYIIAPTGGLENATTDAELDAYIAGFAQTIFHPVGTARMSARSSKDGVVNPDLTVKKVAGLRIVDASVLPFIPSAHPQAATYVFAERASDLIKAAHHR